MYKMNLLHLKRSIGDQGPNGSLFYRKVDVPHFYLFLTSTSTYSSLLLRILGRPKNLGRWVYWSFLFSHFKRQWLRRRLPSVLQLGRQTRVKKVSRVPATLRQRHEGRGGRPGLLSKVIHSFDGYWKCLFHDLIFWQYVNLIANSAELE